MAKKIKVLLVDFAKKNIFFRKCSRYFLKLFGKVKYFKYYLFNKVDDNLIIFESYGGRNFSDSPKALYDEMIINDKYKKYRFIWCFDNPEKYNYLTDKRTMVIKSRSKEYYKYFATAKYWIVNSIVNESIIKKKNQKYVQCWHGTPLKKLRCDIEVNGSILNTVSEIRKRNDDDAKRFDYFISPSSFATSKFISAFNLKKLKKESIVIEEGYPRNDYLFNYKKENIDKIKSSLKIPKDKNVILYAPTFRDNQHKSGIGYTYKSEIDFDLLKKLISKNYVILFRTHYFVANSFDFEQYKNFIIDVSKYDDINDLYIVSDLLITDYSSVFFDYAILRRPIIFYMYDLDDYKNNLRDFYLDIKELPGPIVENENELVDEIKKVSKFKISKKYELFNKKFNYLDDGNSSERVLKRLFGDVDEKKYEKED